MKYKARVIFIQNIWVDMLGSMWVSSLLKSKGFETRIIIETNPKNIMREIRFFAPSVIAFSCMTGMHIWALKIAKLIKDNFKDILVVFGGSHPTFYPELIMYPQVDAICIGEGEYAMVEFMDALSNQRDFSNIFNLWVKKNGEIFRNKLRPFISNLDELPHPDRSHYQRYNYFRKFPIGFFMSGRGCPYACSFCFNHSLMKLQEGNYIRRRSINNIINEINEYKRKYLLEKIHFHDDTFILNKKWVTEFLKIYQKEVRLPFSCALRADLVDEEIIAALKESGCYLASFGIEHGNERIRDEVLNKKIIDRQIINTATFLKKYRIKFKTFNMVGLPNETLQDAYDTVLLNQKINPEYPWCSIFMPYPGTKLGDFAIKNGYVSPDFNYDKIPNLYLEKSLIKQENIDQLVNLQKFFYLAVKFPKLFPLIKRLIGLPLTKLYNLAFSIFYMYEYIYKQYGMRFSTFLQFSIFWLKSSRSLSAENKNKQHRSTSA